MVKAPKAAKVHAPKPPKPVKPQFVATWSGEEETRARRALQRYGVLPSRAEATVHVGAPRWSVAERGAAEGGGASAPPCFFLFNMSTYPSVGFIYRYILNEFC